jgi:hypothetical protein
MLNLYRVVPKGKQGRNSSLTSNTVEDTPPPEHLRGLFQMPGRLLKQRVLLGEAGILYIAALHRP